MFSNNKIENLSFNPRDLSRDDLLKLIELNPNANDEEITQKIQNLLEDQDDPSIINFLYLVLSLLTKPSNNMGQSIFKEEYLGNNPQNTTVLGPNTTQINTTNPSDFTYSVQVEQGKKNPRYIEKFTSYLLVNSALRPLPMTTSSHSFTLDVDFTNVLSIRLNSIFITPSWYNFDHTFANTFFAISGINHTYPNQIYCIRFKPGYYELGDPSGNSDLRDILNESEIIDYPAGGPFDKVSKYVVFSWNQTTNKITITNKQTDPNAPPISIIFYEPTKAYCDLSACEITVLPKLNYNLGYYLGFRGAMFTSTGSYVGQEGIIESEWLENKLIINLPSNSSKESFTQVNLNKSINAILAIDDFNKNSFPSKVNLILPRNNQISLPNYYNASIPCDASGNIPDTKRTTVITQNPRKFTNAELYTIQEILNQNPNNYYLTAFGGGGGSANELATFNLKCGQIFSKRFGIDENTARIYTGAVDIGRLKVTLSTQNGIPLDLNQMDWEFVLEIEQHYQILNQ
jgi:hypothetical protein